MGAGRLADGEELLDLHGRRPIVDITQKWVTIRDTYTLDVVDGIDPGLALAVLWAVDPWVERD